MTPAQRVVLLGGKSTEATSLFARVTTPPTAARKILINNLLVALKQAGILPKIDGLWVLAAADKQADQLNWVQSAFALSEANAPTFTADRGYAGNGSNASLATGINLSTTTGLKLSLNSFHMSAWSLTASPVATGPFMGESADINTYLGPNGVGVGGRVFDADATTVALGADFYCVSRTGATTRSLYKGTTPSPSSTATSTALPNAMVRLLTGEAAFTNAQIAFASIGAGLTDVEEVILHDAVATYLHAVGAI